MNSWSSGRAVYGDGLENRFTLFWVTGVRIPPAPFFSAIISEEEGSQYRLMVMSFWPMMILFVMVSIILFSLHVSILSNVIKRP
jgi:hypothetical protein